MADIQVVFESNAGEVAREISQAEHATVAAARATQALDKTVDAITKHLMGEGRALKGAAAAAREYAKELRASQNLFTGAPGSSRGAGPLQSLLDTGKSASMRTNIQRALAKQNAEIRATMEKGGEHAGGSFGSGLRRSMERLMNRGGFLGAKDSTLANAIGGGASGAGVAATIGISAGLIALSKTIEIADSALAIHKAHLTAAAEGALDYTRAVRAATLANRDAGVAAAQAHGASILGVTAVGGAAGLAMTRQAASASGGDENDAAAAYQALNVRFRGNTELIQQGLAIGSQVAKVTGQSLSQTVATLGQQELQDPDKARDRLTTLGTGRLETKAGAYATAAANVAGSADAVSVQKIRGTLGQADVNADRNLPAGQVGAMDVAARAADPGSAMMVERFVVQQQQLAVLNEVNDKMTAAAKVWDWIRNPGNTVQAGVNRAEDAAVYANGAGH